MDAPRSSSETRQTGRQVFVVGAIAFVIQAFDLTLDSSDNLPLAFPSGFPVAGLLAIVVAILGVMLFLRVLDELVNHVDADLIDKNSVPALRPQDSSHAELKPKSVSTTKSWILFHGPQVSEAVRWAIYAFECLVPIAFSIFILAYCWGSLGSIFSNSERLQNLDRCDGIKLEFIFDHLEEDRAMVPQKKAKADVLRELKLVRHRNPDGTIGGLVASNAKVPSSAIVPFNSMICPGVVLKKGQVVPDKTIIDYDGRAYPNEPRVVR